MRSPRSSRSRADTPDQLEKAGLLSPCSLRNLVSTAKRSKDPKHHKLQSKFVQVLTEVKWSEKFKNGTKAQQALLNARLNPFASSALKPAPALLTAPYRLTDFQTQFLVAQATSQLPGKMPAICACDSALDVTHMLCCKQGESGWLFRHNLLQSSVVSFARVQGLPVEQNVRKSFEDAQQKSKMLEPDAVIYFPERSQWVDFSVTDPTAPSALSKNMIEVGSAMNARADLKNAKYLRKAQSMDADFSPLVVETHPL